jgi:hypothetical protein
VSEYWKEFFRVQSDKLLIAAILVFFHLRGAPELIQTMALGGLLTLINSQRFNLNKPSGGEDAKRLPAQTEK